MTVSYAASIATVSHGTFVRLLFRWRGSVYKLIWPGLLLYCAVYFAIALIYHLIPSSTHNYRMTKRIFVQLCVYAEYLAQAIPISFVLGFYVQLVISRWWTQFANLPTPDSVCFLLASYLRNQPKTKFVRVTKDNEDRPLMFRRTISRYMTASTVLCLNSFSLSMKNRFPYPESLVSSGLMTEQELVICSGFDVVTNAFYVPLVWAITLVTKAHYERMILFDRQLDDIINSIVQYWERLFQLLLHDWVNVPLVYNQVVAVAVYAYFCMTVFSHQFIDSRTILSQVDDELTFLETIITNFTSTNVSILNVTHSYPVPSYINISFVSSCLNNSTFDEQSLKDALYSTTSALDVIPNISLFTILTFIFYNSWLKVAASHLFPFGMDDNDFDVVPLIERNLNTGMCFVDTMLNNPEMMPTLIRSHLKTDPKSPHANRKNAVGVRPEKLNCFDYVPSELPYPDNLKHKLSQSVISGSMALIYPEDRSEFIPEYEADSPSLQNQPSLVPSIGKIMNRVGFRRKSKYLAGDFESGLGVDVHDLAPSPSAKVSSDEDIETVDDEDTR